MSKAVGAPPLDGPRALDLTLADYLQVQQGVRIAVHQPHDFTLEGHCLALVVDLSDGMMQQRRDRSGQDGEGGQQQDAAGHDHGPDPVAVIIDPDLSVVSEYSLKGRTASVTRGTTVMRLLVVEDEQKVADALRDGLLGEGYDVVVARTGADAFLKVTTDTFDAILLDLTLPGRDGLEILKALRERGLLTPVIALTARDTVQDRVVGLDAGADDYLVKPFAFAEVLARVRALLRRSRNEDVRRLRVGDLEIDPSTRRVTRGDRSLELTVKEFEVLYHLAQHARQVVSRDTLAREVWRETTRSTTLDNVMDVHISRLRRNVGIPFTQVPTTGCGGVSSSDHGYP